MPKVSVIVPVYNSSLELRDCLDSLIEQTLQDIEIIVIDDCSTDDSLSIILEYSKKYSNIKAYHNRVNKGQSITRNIGLSIASGEYIAFLDSDDYVSTTMYEELYKTAIDNNNPELIVTGLSFVKDNYYRKNDSNIKRSISIINPILNPDEVLYESPSIGNKLFRRDTIKNYRFLNVSAWEDIAFSYTRFLEAKTVVRKLTTNYFYRRNVKEGVSAKNYSDNEKLEDIFVVADEIENELRKKGMFDFYEKQIRTIQISICLQRVNEIKEWNTSVIRKSVVIEKMFLIIYEKYGNLNDLDPIDIQCKAGFDTTNEYIDFINSRHTMKKM